MYTNFKVNFNKQKFKKNLIVSVISKFIEINVIIIS